MRLDNPRQKLEMMGQGAWQIASHVSSDWVSLRLKPDLVRHRRQNSKRVRGAWRDDALFIGQPQMTGILR